jgi:hypothetical protein
MLLCARKQHAAQLQIAALIMAGHTWPAGKWVSMAMRMRAKLAVKNLN